MQQLGLSESDLEYTILAHTDSILAQGTSGSTGDKTKDLVKATASLAGAVERALRQVARAMVENNERIAEQLEKAGVKIT